MLKRIDSLEIPPDKPFVNDLLNREDSAINLTSLIQSSESPLVLSINAPFGMGKTTFIRMWKAHLEKENHLCLYFNAWENDYTEKPLIALISEVEGIIDSIHLSKKEKSKLSKNLKKYGGDLIKFAAPIATKLITQGLLDSKDLANAFKKIVEQQIDDHKKSKATISSFKRSLQELCQKVGDDEEESKKHSIVFFIDELDRCRPSYAIELLENIKHLFDIEGIYFILGVDREQLAHMVKAIYGVGMDADGYLKKFIDLEYKLPVPSMKDFITFLDDDLNLNSIFQKRHDGASDRGDLLCTIRSLSKIFNISPRNLIQCFNQLGITLRTTETNFHIYPEYLAFLVFLKNARPEKYESYVRTNDFEEVISYMEELPLAMEFVKEEQWGCIKAIMKVSFWEAEKCRLFVKENAESTNKENANSAHLIAHYYRLAPGFHIHKDIVNKIEFSERFEIQP